MSKKITERAVLDAAEIKQFALRRAQQDLSEKLTPAIMRKIDSELNKLLSEQQDPMATDDPFAAQAGGDVPPPVPPTPSPDAGATAPVTPAAAPGATVTDPAVAAASTPIGAPTQQVLGKIETNPESGGQELVIPIDSLFQQADATGGAVPPMPAAETPIDPTAVAPPAAAPGTPELSPTPGDPTEAVPPPALAERSSVILSAIDRILENIAVPNNVPENTAAASVPALGETVLDVNGTVAAASNNKMYESFKQILTAAEDVSATGTVLGKKTVDSLRSTLAQMQKDKVITERLWRLNTRKLDLLENGIRKSSNSYRKDKEEETQDNMGTATKNNKPQSLKDFAMKLFEGAEGFEKEVGKVDPAGDSKGLSDEHAKKASGNPKDVKAELEKAPFKHPAEEGDQGKALLEEIEKEINELMASMVEQDDEGAPVPPSPSDAGDEGAMLMDDEPGVDGAMADDPDAMTITIDLQGVTSDAVENVNVQVDGQPVSGDADDVDVDLAGGEGGELDVDAVADGDGDEMMVVSEVRRLVREQLEALGLKTNAKGKPAAAAAKPAPKKAPVAVNEVTELTKQLNETRVLTARSLFLNKILVSEASLTDVQRRKIVEYLDAGNTVNEVKEIYGKIVKAINKNKAKQQAGGSPLNESATANVNGKQIRQVSDLLSVPMFDADRWSTLAGIGKGR